MKRIKLILSTIILSTPLALISIEPIPILNATHSYHVIVLKNESMELLADDHQSQRIHAIVSGLVQGVGFRPTVNRIALELGLKGTVKNLSDGTVEIWAEGSQEALDNLVKRIMIEPSSGPAGNCRVDHISIFLSNGKGDFDDFHQIPS